MTITFETVVFTTALLRLKVLVKTSTYIYSHCYKSKSILNNVLFVKDSLIILDTVRLFQEQQRAATKKVNFTVKV